MTRTALSPSPASPTTSKSACSARNRLRRSRAGFSSSTPTVRIFMTPRVPSWAPRLGRGGRRLARRPRRLLRHQERDPRAAPVAQAHPEPAVVTVERRDPVADVREAVTVLEELLGRRGAGTVVGHLDLE